MPESCSVAYLDILGFKYLVDQHDELEPLSSAVLGLFDGEETRACAERCHIKCVVVSDSMLAVSVGDRPNYQELVDMVVFCSHVLSLSIYRRLPIRGAISCGTVDWQEKVKIGAPINEAVSWEKNQDWAGVMLAGSAMTFMNRHRACRDQVKRLLFRLDKALLPLKTDPPRKIKAGVVLPHVKREADYAELSRILRELGLESCNLDVQRKLEATANLFDSDVSRHLI